VVPALVILVGLALRVAMLGQNVRLHPDEALFAAQARLVSHQGDLLLRTTDLDKPPLTFYTTALSFRALGTSEFAARLPNVYFSGLSLAALAALAGALYRDRMTAALAVLLWALSPYDVAFAATVFTDVQATFWTLLAALLAARDRWRGAGSAAVLAFASKTNAVAFLPLIVALGMARNARPAWDMWDIGRRVWRLGWLLAAGIGLVLAWDWARAPHSFWSLNLARNDPGRLIRSAEVWPRLERWAHWLGFVTGSPLLNGALLALGGAWLAWGLWRRRARSDAANWLIAGFAVAFLGWLWLVAFNTYDRYLHTLVPFLLLFAAHALTGAARALRARVPDRWPGNAAITAGGLLLVGLLVLPGLADVLRGDAPIGGDQGQHTGIDRLADYLNRELAGEVVYDHWLGWELAYYLGDAPPVALVYSPLPEALADTLRAQPAPRYFVAPSPAAAAPWRAALDRAGITAQAVYHDRTQGFVVYRLAPN
jgi:4-amino-4-deoxy-L-arabinose transferase-like glycosyltransferase